MVTARLSQILTSAIPPPIVSSSSASTSPANAIFASSMFGEKIGDVLWDRLRIELQDKTFGEIEDELYRILVLPQVKRCCIDATGLGMQLAERAKERFGWKIEGVTFRPQTKEELANNLRIAFEQRLLRIDPDPKLRAIKKEVHGDHTRFIGEADDGHCDRFWAKALRQHAAITRKVNFGAFVVD